MRYFRYNHQDGDKFVSEDDIINENYMHFFRKMIRLGMSKMATHNECIRNFVIINWAWEITEREYNEHRS